MSEPELKKVLRQSTDAVKRALRAVADQRVLAAALAFEVGRYRPRKRVVAWLCARIWHGMGVAQ
jgi:hypothetical protein